MFEASTSFSRELPAELNNILTSKCESYDGKTGEFQCEVPLIQDWDFVSCEFVDTDRITVAIRFTSPEGGDVTLLAKALDYAGEPGEPYRSRPGHSTQAQYLSLVVQETIETRRLDYKGVFSIDQPPEDSIDDSPKEAKWVFLDKEEK
ncbi:MAG TPA: hypothetical protein PKB15_07435 [Acidimicrobiia bacterium]|nr:hypothetical protein [Acidimicrobiia bacterium]